MNRRRYLMAAAKKAYQVQFNKDYSHFTYTPEITDIEDGASMHISVSPKITHSSDVSEGDYYYYLSVSGATFSEDSNQYGFTISNPTTNVIITENRGYKEPTPVCLHEDTQVLLANGQTKAIKDIGYNDLLVSWDSFLGRFVEQYPVWITEGNENCVKNALELITESGRVLRICSAHDVYDLKTHRFRNIRWNNDNNINIGDIVLARYENGKLVEDKIVETKNISYDYNEIKAYSVYVPMGQSIITDEFLTSGNFMFDELTENFLKAGEASDTYNDIIKEAILSASINYSDEQRNKDFIWFKNTIDEAYTEQVFYCSDHGLAKYFSDFLCYHLPPEIDCTKNPAVVESIRKTFDNQLARELVHGDICNVKINDTVFEVPLDDYFVLPFVKDKKYFDLSTYRLYNPGDSIKIITSTVILELDINDKI